MSPESVKTAIREAERFIRLAKLINFTTVTGEHKYSYVNCSPLVTGAARRASMDLTRALAQMRKP